MSERSLFFASEQLYCSLGVVPLWLLGLFCFVLNLVFSCKNKPFNNIHNNVVSQCGKTHASGNAGNVQLTRAILG